jgi:DNA helicase-2/ATP-dependent DNA helicase PcrA
LDESGYTAMWQADKSPDAPGRLDNLKELVRAIADFETLQGFLDHVALVMENEEQSADDKLSMMTLHGAKGLEFDTVFLPGWEEGVFPNQRALDEGGLKSLEEERRLAYVGITRARKRAIISHAANRRIYANWQSAIPSRFIEELPAEFINVTGSASAAKAERLSAAPMFPLNIRRPQAPDSWEPPARPARADKIPIGARVFHPKFGYGIVTATDDDRLDIRFETSGEKRVLDRFVERQDRGAVKT